MDTRTEKMEEALFAALAEVDSEMESRYGGKFALHPARPPHGTAASRQYDGLFELGAGFSAGFGSKFGPGYALALRIVTLEDVPDSFRNQFEEEAVGLLRESLARHLPGRKLDVVRDGGSWKIVGDLSI